MVNILYETMMSFVSSVAPEFAASSGKDGCVIEYIIMQRCKVNVTRAVF